MALEENNFEFSSDKGKTSLYIHIPFCKAKCPYCDFYSEPVEKYDVDRVLKTMIKEMEAYPLGETIETVYIGGGSPSVLTFRQIMMLVSFINENCSYILEFTVEVNPGEVKKDIINELRSAGVNRLSFGLQSFDDDELKILGRRHSAKDNYQALDSAKNAGFANISIDLIFAVPGSSIGDWKENLEKAVNTNARHISAYSLTFEKETEFYSMLDSGDVEPVEEEVDRQMYETAIDLLKSKGFQQYEISNFAQPEFECLHNLSYWENEPYIGIGPSAGSYYKGQRRLNISDVNEYVKAIEEGNHCFAEFYEPNEVEKACETAVLNLRTIKGVDLKKFELKTGFDFHELFSEPIAENTNSGLLKEQQGRIHLTRKALPIANSVLSDFSFV